MHSLLTALLLAVLAISQAIAAPSHAVHGHYHTKKEVFDRSAEASPEPLPQSTVSLITSTALSKLEQLGCQTGLNAVSNNGKAWVGSDGTYTNEFSNQSGEDLILVVWGPDGSWVNANTPLITAEIASGSSMTVSFASGAIGAWSAIYGDTIMVDGQVSNTWGEYTFSEEGVVDVSREVNMSGHGMSITGPSCMTDMNTCVFVCASGNSCLTNYELLNCEAGSQSGAQYGTFGGLPSGGCGGLGSAAKLWTTLS